MHTAISAPRSLMSAPRRAWTFCGEDFPRASNWSILLAVPLPDLGGVLQELSTMSSSQSQTSEGGPQGGDLPGAVTIICYGLYWTNHTNIPDGS